GRKVLFVAEKMAALDVVHRRLQQVGLGPLALELHSNKVNKRTVLEELRRTRDGQVRPARGGSTVIQKLTDVGGALNGFASRLHTPLPPCGLTPQRIIGRMIRTHQFDVPTGFALDGAANWTADRVADIRNLIAELADRLRPLGPVPRHSWRGVCRGALDPVEL